MNITIAGAGNIGFQLAKRFNFLDNSSITIIESSPERAALAQDSLDALVVRGNAAKQTVLIDANVQNADVFAALTDKDELNLIACKIAKKLGAKNTIARVKKTDYISDEFCLNSQELGVDLIIQPEKETANAIIKLIKMSSTTDTIDFEDGKIRFSGIRLDESAPILKIPFSELGQKYNNPPLRVVAIKRGQFTIIPRGSDRLQKGDQVFFISHNNYINEALDFFGKKNSKIDDILIIGGGQIGRFIAKELEGIINIKIIESDENKANKLAENLKKSLVIHGDGSDLDLVVSEGLKEMDEFIAVTGDDETNIITSIVARHIKVPRTITLISKNEYLPLAPAIGLDAIVSKQQITVNSIESFLKKKLVANVAEIPGVDAEIIEFIVNKNSKITKNPLKKISFPNQSIVGAVLKNDELVIPTGDTKIEEGDKVIVFTLPKSLKAVEKLFY
jgi:trk system potassium uptake protein TrkA